MARFNGLAAGNGPRHTGTATGRPSPANPHLRQHHPFLWPVPLHGRHAVQHRAARLGGGIGTRICLVRLLQKGAAVLAFGGGAQLGGAGTGRQPTSFAGIYMHAGRQDRQASRWAGYPYPPTHPPTRSWPARPPHQPCRYAAAGSAALQGATAAAAATLGRAAACRAVGPVGVVGQAEQAAQAQQPPSPSPGYRSKRPPHGPITSSKPTRIARGRPLRAWEVCSFPRPPWQTCAAAPPAAGARRWPGRCRAHA